MNFDLSSVDLATKTLCGFGNEEIGVNNRYLTKHGKPWLPVMGEIHFSRVPEQDWDRELKKMKAGGIEIIASYLIWNHHEATDGKFDWSANK
ncbi:MAG: beta-galactosidase, partial [Oscillospiraceae bacterium]